MQYLRLLTACLLCALLIGCEQSGNSKSNNIPPTQSNKLPLGKGFDFYVLALSWSPGYCASEGKKADKSQCSGARRYEFVVHGLWPQFTNGYPSNCDNEYGRDLSNTTIRQMLDIMPSYGLIKHQWRKHGSCSGLSETDYFETTRAAYEKIKTPPSFKGLQETKTVTPLSIEKLFQVENQSIPSDAIAVTCKRNYVRDVRICMTKDLSTFVSCPEVDRNSCRSKSIAVAPIR